MQYWPKKINSITSTTTKKTAMFHFNFDSERRRRAFVSFNVHPSDGSADMEMNSFPRATKIFSHFRTKFQSFVIFAPYIFLLFSMPFSSFLVRSDKVALSFQCDHFSHWWRDSKIGHMNHLHIKSRVPFWPVNFNCGADLYHSFLFSFFTFKSILKCISVKNPLFILLWHNFMTNIHFAYLVQWAEWISIEFHRSGILRLACAPRTIFRVKWA